MKLGAIVFAAMIAMLSPANAQSVDPQSLLGEWWGEVKGTANLQYFLTITKVDGNNVEGKAHAIGARAFPEYPIWGTINGNVLKYQDANKDLTVELVIDGARMNGTGKRASSGARGEFSLLKKQ